MTIRGAASHGGTLVCTEARQYDALLVVSYGGPNGPDDVMPFLENATRGRGIPPTRLLEVAAHYHRFGGISPINAQNRALVSALREEFAANGPDLPIFIGNRNWHPLLQDTIQKMGDRGVRSALALVTSAFSSYSGCRQYRDDIVRACEAVGPHAPTFDKVRVFFNHPGFIVANAESLRETLDGVGRAERAAAHVVFTAHSIPVAMASRSAYEAQLVEASRLVAEASDVERWSLAYQSRSGPPHVPWLGPDIGDELDRLASQGVRDVVVLPIGFLSDHMEVRYDLDCEARDRAASLGVRLHRAATVGTRASFITALRDLIMERMTEGAERRAVGRLGPSHDVCPLDCCGDGRTAMASYPLG